MFEKENQQIIPRYHLYLVKTNSVAIYIHFLLIFRTWNLKVVYTCFYELLFISNEVNVLISKLQCSLISTLSTYTIITHCYFSYTFCTFYRGCEFGMKPMIDDITNTVFMAKAVRTTNNYNEVTYILYTIHSQTTH